MTLALNPHFSRFYSSTPFENYISPSAPFALNSVVYFYLVTIYHPKTYDEMMEDAVLALYADSN